MDEDDADIMLEAETVEVIEMVEGPQPLPEEPVMASEPEPIIYPPAAPAQPMVVEFVECPLDDYPPRPYEEARMTEEQMRLAENR